MADHKVNITFDGTFHVSEDPKHVHTNDTISWKLVGSGGYNVVKLIVSFNYAEANPFNPPRKDFEARAGKYTSPGHLDKPATKNYRYTIIAVLKDGTQKPYDPKIIFDDVPLNLDLVLTDDTLSKLGTAAQSAFQGLLSNLNDTAKLKRDPNALFYPGGINNITVSATVPLGLGASLSVSITVSGS